MTLLKCLEKEKPRMDKIHCKKVLIVEGKDECFFFRVLLDHIGINGVEVHDAGGKDNFRHRIPALIDAHGFDEVEIIGIIRDADDNALDAFTNIKNLMDSLNDANHQFVTPSLNYTFGRGDPQIGIYILPGNSENGMLEDLCLKTVQEHPIMANVEDFTDKAVNIPECCPSNVSKTKTQVFLAAMPKIVCSVGLGAKKEYWDLDSDVLIGLKEFLEKLR